VCKYKTICTPYACWQKISNGKENKIKYQEGDIIAVPLQTSGYATGLVARTNSKGVAFGYFFGPKLNEVSELTLSRKLQPESAILIYKFGDTSVDGKGWPIIGRYPEFSKEVWRLPFLYRQAMGDSYYSVCEYNDKLDCMREWKVDLDDPIIKEMLPDGLLGPVLLQIKLTRLLD
jgi:Immunity protein 26